MCRSFVNAEESVPKAAYAIRQFVAGREGWLFADTTAGAQASANLYSLVETCNTNGINPYRYLVWLFAKQPHATTADDYDAPLRWNISTTRRRFLREATPCQETLPSCNYNCPEPG